MNPQTVPGVRDAKLRAITARRYAVLAAIAVGVCAATVVAVTHLPGDDTVDVISFDLATPAATSCVYDSATRRTTIRTHLDSTTRHHSEIVLTAGVVGPGAEEPVARTTRTIGVRGHHEADYTFVVDVPVGARGGDLSCFVETAV